MPERTKPRANSTAGLALLLALSLAAVAFVPAAFALDDRAVASPDGRIAFRIFVAPQEPGGLSRLAYQVLVQGKLLVETSYLGLDIENQEPLLGENEGLLSSKTDSAAADYRSLTAEYMQNGSIGRRINVEVRVYNDGVAFRYLLPRQTPLEELLIADEVTEFRFPQKVDTPARVPLPLILPQPGVGWVAITEVRSGAYPPASLAHLDANALVTRLALRPGTPSLALEGTTPLTGPWRVLIFGPDKDRLMQSGILHSLNR
ncbi:MAG: glycoside hydrolase family 97 N-terminal domain-containing protein [Bryobacteraceae bacterium]